MKYLDSRVFRRSVYVLHVLIFFVVWLWNALRLRDVAVKQPYLCPSSSAHFIRHGSTPVFPLQIRSVISIDQIIGERSRVACALSLSWWYLTPIHMSSYGVKVSEAEKVLPSLRIAYEYLLHEAATKMYRIPILLYCRAIQEPNRQRFQICEHI